MPIYSFAIPIRLVAAAGLATAVLTACNAGSEHSEPDFAWSQPKPSMESVELPDPVRQRTWRLDGSGLYFVDSSRSQADSFGPDNLAGTRKLWHSGVTANSANNSAPSAPCDEDITLDQNGNLVLAEKRSGNLLRINRDDFSVSIHTPRLTRGTAVTLETHGLAGITYAPAWRSYFAMDRSGRALWIIDEQLTKARPVKLTQAILEPCRLSLPTAAGAGVDEWLRYRRLCVLAAGRSVLINMNPQLRSAEVLNRSCETPFGRPPGALP